mmetsp:Transcript_78776/g.156026  ORF Transcript_78776/g.156026 Transcript_78776/m.156026 type:complete len:205 (+) Transcript_78776:670-1284(+)
MRGRHPISRLRKTKRGRPIIRWWRAVRITWGVCWYGAGMPKVWRRWPRRWGHRWWRVTNCSGGWRWATWLPVTRWWRSIPRCSYLGCSHRSPRDFAAIRRRTSCRVGAWRRPVRAHITWISRRTSPSHREGVARSARSRLRWVWIYWAKGSRPGPCNKVAATPAPSALSVVVSTRTHSCLSACLSSVTPVLSPVFSWFFSFGSR